MIWNLAQFGEKAALITETQSISYNELAETENKIAEKIEKRCLVFLLTKNMPGAIAGYISFLNHKVVPVLLDSNLDGALLQRLIAIYMPQYLWVPSTDKEKLSGYEEKLSLWGYVLLKTKYHVYQMQSELAVLLPTSGSTGSSKMVRQSYKNILSNTWSIIECLEISSKDCAITSLPMNYVYGLSILNTHLYVGATCVVTEKSIFQKEFWQLFKKNKVTSFSGVPYIYEMLDKLRLFKMELPSLKVLTQAGGKLSPLLHKKFAIYAKEKKLKFIVMYGATEATARMAYLPAEKSIEKYGSIGIAIPRGAFAIRNESKIYSETEETGELIYYGENVSMGYAACSDDLNRGDENHGVLYTGDIARKDKDGYYYIIGRAKRFLKLFGKKVNLDEVEQLLKEKYSEEEIACSGIDDKLYIFITALNTEKNILEYISQKMDINQKAFIIKVIFEIPKNAAGKTVYAELEKFYD